MTGGSMPPPPPPSSVPPPPPSSFVPPPPPSTTTVLTKPAHSPTSPSVGSVPGAAIVVGAIGLVMVGLSMFVLDWTDGATYADFADNAETASGMPFLDRLAVWHLQWLGYLLAVLAVGSLAVALFAARSSGRVSHRLAAVASGVAAVWSALTIVRLFRTLPVDPGFGAWLMPAGYLVMIAAVVLSARRVGN